MTRAAHVLAIASLAAFAGPARSDPSFTVPAPSGTAPSSSAPQNPAPPASAPNAMGKAAPAPPKAAAPAAPSPAPTARDPQARPAPGAAAADDGGRYSFHRIGDSFIRLDTQTGQVAKCGWAATGWSCQAAADERAALDSEIARLQRENAELKKSLLSHGVELPAGTVEASREPPPVPPANIPDTTSDKSPKGPSDADLNRAIAFMKHVWQRLVDLMVDLQRDIQRKS